MKINIVDPYFPKIENIKKKFNACLTSGLVTNNQKNVIQFEINLKKKLNCKNTPVAFSSGEMALFHLLQAWKHTIKENKKVYAIVPSFTFSGTINALILNNIEPIFCDINQDLLINLNNIKLKKNIRFLIAVSVYGNIPNLEIIKNLNKKMICIIDSAPAFGSTYDGKVPSNFGIDEIYSFHATKILSTMEGGCAITSNKKVHKYLQRLRNFGQFENKIGNVDIPGLNSKMQEISAITGNFNIKKFEQRLKKRKKVIKNYKSFFLDLEEKKIIKNMDIKKNVFCIYLYFPIILLKSKIDQLQLYLKKKGIYTRRYYTAVHKLKFYKKKFKCTYSLEKNKCSCKNYCKEYGLKNTNFVSKRILALPLHSDASIKKQKYLFSTIKKFFKI